MPSTRAATPPASRLSVPALALVASPLAGLVGSLLMPAFTQGMSGELAFIAEHRTRWLAGMSFDLLFSLLLIPAALGLMAMMRRNGSRLGPVAAAALVVAGFVHSAMLGYQLTESSLVAHAAGRAQATALADAMYADPAFTMLVVPFSASMFLGLLATAVLLWRSRVAPLWVAATIVAAVVVEIVGPPAWKARAMFALLLLALGWLGVRGREPQPHSSFLVPEGSPL